MPWVLEWAIERHARGLAASPRCDTILKREWMCSLLSASGSLARFSQATVARVSAAHSGAFVPLSFLPGSARGPISRAHRAMPDPGCAYPGYANIGRGGLHGHGVFTRAGLPAVQAVHPWPTPTSRRGHPRLVLHAPRRPGVRLSSHHRPPLACRLCIQRRELPCTRPITQARRAEKMRAPQPITDTKSRTRQRSCCSSATTPRLAAECHPARHGLNRTRRFPAPAAARCEAEVWPAAHITRDPIRRVRARPWEGTHGFPHWTAE